MAEEIKDRLKKLRTTLGLKQREVAERLGIRVSLVGNWESGINAIPPTRIYQLCHEYNVRREWLETGEGEMFEKSESSPYDEAIKNGLSPFAATIYLRYTQLPKEQREVFEEVFAKLITETQIVAPEKGSEPEPKRDQTEPTDSIFRLVADSELPTGGDAFNA